MDRLSSYVFNSTHTLVGLTLARAGVDRWVRHATLTAIVGANLPDIDIVTQIGGTASYLEHHRGFTHSLLGIPVLALVLTAAIYKFSGSFWKTLAVAMVAVATHPLLDYANTYGLRPFLPFDSTWFYGDALFIIDPYFDLMLAAALVVGYYAPRQRRVLAMAGLAVVLVYTGARVELRDRGRAALANFTEAVSCLERSAVMPRMFNPLVWTGIVETCDAVSKVDVEPFNQVGRPTARATKARMSAVIARASQARDASALVGFARFPVVRVDETGAGYQVTFLDFRFYREGAGRGLAARVVLDDSLEVVDQRLGFVEPVPWVRNAGP